MRLYKLTKNYIDPSGNAYFGGDREYTEFELPTAAQTPTYSVFREVESFEKEELILDRSARVIVKSDEMEVKVQQNSSIIEESIKPSFEQLPAVKVVQDTRTNINSASPKELEALKFVGKTTAVRVIEGRIDGLFDSIEALDARVPLVGRSWKELEASVRFN